MRTRAVVLLACILLLGTSRDPLTSAIERWSAYLRDNKDTNELWMQIKNAAGPVLEKAGSALRAGRRNLALQRFAAAHANLAAAEYAFAPERKAEQTDLAKYEALWKRAGSSLQAPAARSFSGLQPAIVRATAEAAAPQVREFYSASLVYARATEPASGLFYLGNAYAQERLITFTRQISTPTAKKAPPLRSIAPEIDALEGEVLAMYRPPLSIDRHPEFIVTSAAIKEARELDAAGLRYGALMRYLDATRRFGVLAGSKLSAEEATRKIRGFERQLNESGVDHSIAQLSIEAADDDPSVAPSVAERVLPRYLAALQPAAAPKPRSAPGLTVTLIRWPYT